MANRGVKRAARVRNGSERAVRVVHVQHIGQLACPAGADSIDVKVPVVVEVARYNTSVAGPSDAGCGRLVRKAASRVHQEVVGITLVWREVDTPDVGE